MEYVTMRNARWGYTQLTADKGFLIRSKETGKVYEQVTVPNPDAFEAIPLPTSSKARKKRVNPHEKNAVIVER